MACVEKTTFGGNKDTAALIVFRSLSEVSKQTQFTVADYKGTKPNTIIYNDISL